MMSEYLPLDTFKTIYVVDLCKSLCEQARRKVEAKGWKNVVVVEGDACTFVPPKDEKASLVTFSYSLSSKFSTSILVDDGFHTYLSTCLTCVPLKPGLHCFGWSLQRLCLQ